MKKRFIAFLGNLPFDTTEQEIIAFFSGCGLPEVRLTTDRQASRLRIRCVPHEEFQKALRMHHQKMKGRRVNVEVTAGGGGNGAARQEKIKAKNQRIQRFREKLHEKATEYKAKQG
jgi:nucleolar protein 6